jgi:hypothetical protein
VAREGGGRGTKEYRHQKCFGSGFSNQLSINCLLLPSFSSSLLKIFVLLKLNRIKITDSLSLDIQTGWFLKYFIAI